MEKIAESFGEWVRRSRKAAGVTQERLGEMVGLTKAQISRIESGEQGTAATTVALIAKVTGADPHEGLALLAGIEPIRRRGVVEIPEGGSTYEVRPGVIVVLGPEPDAAAPNPAPSNDLTVPNETHHVMPDGRDLVVGPARSERDQARMIAHTIASEEENAEEERVDERERKRPDGRPAANADPD